MFSKLIFIFLWCTFFAYDSNLNFEETSTKNKIIFHIQFKGKKLIYADRWKNNSRLKLFFFLQGTQCKTSCRRIPSSGIHGFRDSGFTSDLPLCLFLLLLVLCSFLFLSLFFVFLLSSWACYHCTCNLISSFLLIQIVLCFTKLVSFAS